MPIVSGGDLALQRGQAHKSDVYVSFLIPPILWKARIDDGSIVKGQTSFTYDGGTGTDYGLIGALQEIWVGTTDGDYDVGRLRVRSISTGDGGVTGGVTVAGHSLPLGDDQYLTFLHHYPLRPRYSYLDPSTKVWYMDTILAYTDEHEEPPPVVVAGPHRAGFLDSTPEFTINVDASDSYVIAAGASITSYALSVVSTSGTPTVTFSAVTGLGDIKFTLPGYYWAKYTVTDSNGKSQDSYRCYFVHEDNRASSWYPFVDMETLEIGGDWDAGGWIAAMAASDNYSFDDIPEHTLTVIWRRSWFGDTEKNITFLPDACSTIFAGYVRDEAEEQDFATGVGLLDLSMGTVEGKLRQLYSFSASIVAQKTSVDDWFEGPTTMTVGTIAHHLLRWRSTLFEVADVIGLMDNTLLRFAFEPDDANLYDMVNTFTYESGIRAKLVCDQGGRMHLAYDIQLLTNSERGALSTVFDIKKDAGAADYGGRLSIPRQPENEVPFITSDGIYWDGSTWDPEEPDLPYATGDWCVIAPGGVGLEEGPTPKDFPLQTVSSLDHLRQIAGRFLAKTNNHIEELRVEFKGDYLGVLDVAYDDAVWTISLLAGDTPRGRAWTDKPLFCRNIVARFRGDEGVFNVNASFEVEADGIDGEETECPSFPLLGGSIPTLPFPNGVPDDTPGALLTGASVNYKSAMTNDWTKRISQDVLDLIEDPHWRIKQASTSPSDAIVFRCGDGYIKRSTDAFISVDVDVTPSNDPPNDAGDSPAPTATGVTYVMMEGSYTDQDNFAVLANWENASFEWRSWLAYTDDNGTTWSWKYLGETPDCEEYGTKSSSFSSSIMRDLLGGNEDDQIIEVDTDKYVITYTRNISGTYTSFVKALTINPATQVVTFGNEVNPGANAGNLYSRCKLTKVDTNKFAVAYAHLQAYNGGSGTYPTVKIGTISGVTITLGAAQNLVNFYESGEDHWWSTATALFCPSSSSIVAYKPGTEIMVTDGDDCVMSGMAIAGRWGTISGTTINWSEITDCGAVDPKTVGKYHSLGSTGGATTYTVKKMGSVGLACYGASSPLSTAYVGVVVIGSAEGAHSNQVEIISTIYEDYEYLLTIGLDAWALCALSSTKALFLWQRWVYDFGVDDYYEVYGAIITVNGTSDPVVGAHQLLYDTRDFGSTPDHPYWLEEFHLAPLTSTRAAFVYVLWDAALGKTCNSAVMLDISGDLITKDEECSQGFNDGARWIYPQSSTEFMAVGYSKPSYPDPDWSGRVWTGITATDIESCVEYSENYALGLSLSKEGASDKAWVTVIDSKNNQLNLLEIALPGLLTSDTFSLGGGTWPELISGVWIAYPFVPFGYDDVVYIYGRMDDPQSLGSPAHIIRTVDGGSSFGLIEGGWGTNHCGALVVTTSNYLYAVRNRGDTESKLYKDNIDNVLVVKLTFPFSAEVAPHGMLVDFVKGDVYACAWDADAIMVVKVPPPLWVAKDITYDHDNTEGIWSIIGL